MTSAGRHIAFPFRIGADGRSVTPASDSDHVRDEVLQLLLTNPGERPFLTEFGGGVRRLVFEPASDVLRGVTKARISQALSRWLGHRLTVEALEVEFEGERIDILVKFRPAGSEDSRLLRFQRQGQ
ncbi:GPW/gp25 family protein [Roseitranquillus sediminis]|uniref:GPW/gp25 family protein n=1 Tax=Roseitranquillus sediminis TaxID=2809051 RepID=UPI001D0C4BA2|nr:GPW/gp25 family protein [Roseitranquillus sediminis]MBM9594977.1 GPW/gp25 family protein [Roseitranquillus sediminis]